MTASTAIHADLDIGLTKPLGKRLSGKLSAL